LLSLCPRTTVDIETKTQEKVIRNAQKETAAKAAGFKRKTVDEDKDHHVTHTHNHVFGAAAVDMLETLKEKRQAIADSVKMFEQVGDNDRADAYRKHWVNANDDYIKALDDKIMPNRIHALSSTSSHYNLMHEPSSTSSAYHHRMQPSSLSSSANHHM